MKENIVSIIAQLRQWMQAEGWDAVVISGTDPHSSEYLPQRWQVRQWVSGFTGSAGTVVVTADQQAYGPTRAILSKPQRNSRAQVLLCISWAYPR